jgi:hypothetical protein
MRPGQQLDHLFGHFLGRRVIVASVAYGSYVNRGNALIERATFKILGLPDTTPRFSVFEPISDDLLATINRHDCLLVTGCTTLQDDEWHQRCFDAQFERITIPKICFGGTFFCEPEDRPSLRVARLYDTPIGVRDPWAYDYLTAHGVPCVLVGCPTVLDSQGLDSWRPSSSGVVLASSSPALPAALRADYPSARLIAHDADAPGADLCLPELFDDVSLVITSRLHAALPAIAQGIPVRFFSPRLAGSLTCGSNRYTLLEFLNIPLDGSSVGSYPTREIRQLKNNCAAWLDGIFQNWN